MEKSIYNLNQTSQDEEDLQEEGRNVLFTSRKKERKIPQEEKPHNQPPFSLILLLNTFISMCIQISVQYYFISVKATYILDVYKGMALLSLLLPFLYLVYICVLGERSSRRRNPVTSQVDQV
jgi:hypothetical protein